VVRPADQALADRIDDQALTSGSLPSPADLRALIARRRVPIYKLAAVVEVHPIRLGRMINEIIEMPASVAQRLSELLAAQDGAA
jgi:hypothetical protein